MPLHCTTYMHHEYSTFAMYPHRSLFTVRAHDVGPCRAAYHKVQSKGAELAQALSLLSKGGEVVDMAYALMCETMDVLGLVGFDKAYHNLDNLSNRQPAKVLDVRLLTMCPHAC